MITFITDPHLGLGARTNTSAKSTVLLDEKISVIATGLVNAHSNVVLAGDLFHRSHNKEKVIAAGIAVASKCDIVLGGNHDNTQRADDQSSMDIVATVCDSVLQVGVGKVEIFPELIFDSGETMTVVPHHSSQELFDKAVEEACKYKGNIVTLHCNFNNPFVDEIETALNLSIEQAEELLKHYDYIVIGHEHNTRWEMNDRLLALGNIHPTGYSDISNKYLWTFTKEGGFEKELIWDKSTGYMSLSAADIYNLPEEEFELDEDDASPQFVDIVGSIDAENMPDLAHRISLIWDKWQPFMVRNQANAVTETTESLMEEGYKIEDFSSKIRGGLADAPELLEKFNALVCEVGE